MAASYKATREQIRTGTREGFKSYRSTRLGLVAHRVTLVPGDGIGPEVAEAARSVVAAVGVGVEWDVQPAGAAVMEAEGTPLPDRVLESIRQSRTALKGPITTPVGTGFRSVNVALRQELDLFAAVRPTISIPGIASRFDEVDLVVIRENTEDLYAGIEFERGSREAAELRRAVRDLAGYEIAEDAGVTLKPISVTGTRRIAQFAFDHARRNHRTLVTVGHKANIMRFSDGVFLSIAEAEARNHLDVAFDECQIDEMALRLVTEPEGLDVLLLPNLYGDIVSDLCAGLAGGLGLAPGANLGWEYAVFEPVHGSAPDIAGRGVANPIAIILSAAMMLSHLAEIAAAEAVRAGVRVVMADGAVRTPDLGGRSTTGEVASAVAEAARTALELGADSQADT
jgi:isocitrate dehydrogenase (NAD+)